MMKFLSSSIAVASLALAASNLHAQVSGIFHIGGVGDPYATIQEAIDDLVQVGVSGPVDLVVAPGVYPGGLVIAGIPGAGPGAPILIRPLNPGAYDVNITGLAVYFAGVVDIIDPFVSLHELVITVDNPLPGSAPISTSCVSLSGDDVTLSSCHLTDNAATTHGVSLYGDRARLLDNVVEYVGPEAGGTGIHSIGAFEKMTISDNLIKGFIGGMYLAEIDEALISDNAFVQGSVPAGPTSWGIALLRSGNMTIARNKIVMYEAYAGFMLSGPGDAGIERTIENNMISIQRTSPQGYPSTGLACSIFEMGVVQLEPSPSEWFVRHNSMYIEGNELRGVYFGTPVSDETTITSNSIRLIGDSCTGLSFAGSAGMPWPKSDHNNVSILGAGNRFGLYATKALIQANTTMEDHSISAVPRYLSKTNLHIMDNSPNIDRAFIDPLVPVDFDKDPRQHWDPEYDIGADEYGNLGLKSLVVAPPVLPAATVVIGAYPNPAQDQVVFELPDDEVQPFMLHGADGRVVLSGMSVPGQAIRLDGLAAGTYLARFPRWPGATTRVVVAH